LRSKRRIDAHRQRVAARPPGTVAQQVARRGRLVDRGLVQPHAELAFEPQHQLGSREAVDAQAALELVVERDRGRRAPAQLGQQLAQHRQKARRSVASVVHDASPRPPPTSNTAIDPPAASLPPAVQP